MKGATLIKKFKIYRKVGLICSDAEVKLDNLLEDYIAVTKDVLRCATQFPLPPYFQNLLKYYGITLMQITPNSYRHMIALIACKELGFPEPTLEEFAYIYSLKGNYGDYRFYHKSKWHSRDVKAFRNAKDNKGQWKRRWFIMESLFDVKSRVPG